MQGTAYCQASSPMPEDKVLPMLQHTISPELQLAHTIWRSAMDQVTQMRTMLSSFLGQKQAATHTAFCNSSSSRTTSLASDRSFTGPLKTLKGPLQDHLDLPNTIKSCCLKNSPNKKHYTAPHKTLWPQTHKKRINE